MMIYAVEVTRGNGQARSIKRYRGDGGGDDGDVHMHSTSYLPRTIDWKHRN
jgi:hypothetical protein